MPVTAAPAVIVPVLDEQFACREFVDAVLEGCFTFNGETYTLGTRFDWTANPSDDLEWQILLHKFYYAPGLGRAFAETGDGRYRDRWIGLTEAFIEQVAVDFLPADVAGRRIQNWIYAWHFFREATPRAFAARFEESLLNQAVWLRQNLTPARNHRTLELLALFLVEIAFPSGDPQMDWVCEEIAANLAQDFRPDGVHVEQSTDYHHLVLRNALAIRGLADANGIPLAPEVDQAIQRALEFALHIHRPDGYIPSLSDGDSRSFLELLAAGAERYGDERLRYVATRGRAGQKPDGPPHRAFPDGGYYILRSGWGETERFEDERWLVFDCGPLGEGNHGHLDLLSFEFYAYGRALIVDPGRYTYHEGGEENWRVRFRGTGYHNTVQVDARNQTRYEFHKRRFKVRGPQPEFACTHFAGGCVRGIARSAEYDVEHEREVRLVEGRRIEIRDWLRSPSEHTYDLLFHLNDFAQGNCGLFEENAGTVVNSPGLTITQAPGTRGSIEEGWVSRSYGEKQPAPIVRFRAAGRNITFFTVLDPRPVSLRS